MKIWERRQGGRIPKQKIRSQSQREVPKKTKGKTQTQAKMRTQKEGHEESWKESQVS